MSDVNPQTGANDKNEKTLIENIKNTEIGDINSINDNGSVNSIAQKGESKNKVAVRISIATLVGNAILFLFKLVVGIKSKSSALISDAVHTASDVLTTVMVMFGVKISGKNADRSHQYGHEKIEPIISTILATILIVVAFGIGKSGVDSIIGCFRGESIELSVDLGTFAVVIASILFKEVMFQYTRFGAKKISSSAMLADAWHHRSDALSSVAVLVGIAGAKWFNLPVLDPIMSIIVCIIIVKVGVQIYAGAVNQLVDKAADDDEVKKIVYYVSAVGGVKKIDLVRTRIHADRLYVDVEISVDGNLPLREAHGIAELVHDNVEAAFPNIKHCMVHVNPYSD